MTIVEPHPVRPPVRLHSHPPAPEPHRAGSADADLVTAAQRGDTAAFAALVRRHGGQAFRTALRVTGDAHDAADVVQESFLSAWRGLADFRGQSSFSTWLHVIVTHRALNLVTRRRLELSWLDIAPTPDPEPGPAETFTHRVTAAAVTAAIDELPPQQRLCATLHHLQGLSYRSVAARIGTTEPAVRSHLYRARRALRARLAPWQ